MVLNERLEVCKEPTECNAVNWITVYLESNPIDTGIKFSEWREIIRMMKQGSKILPGEQMRVYEWVDTDYCPEPWEIRDNKYDVDTTYENPKIAAICTRLNLWP